MTEKRIVVPEGMLKAVWDVDGDGLGYIEEHRTLDHLEAALRWLDRILDTCDVDFHRAILESERERYPGSDNDLYVISCRVAFEYGASFARNYVRRMYLASEPEVLEEIKDLLLPNIDSGFFKPEVVNERMAECFRRGQKARK